LQAGSARDADALASFAEGLGCAVLVDFDVLRRAVARTDLDGFACATVCANGLRDDTRATALIGDDAGVRRLGRHLVIHARRLEVVLRNAPRWGGAATEAHRDEHSLRTVSISIDE
jgi:hypothetical protein